MKNHLVGIASGLLLSSFASAPAQAGHYDLDLDHSSVGFTVRHLVISKVKGKFSKFAGAFDYDAAKPDASKVTVTLQSASIDTGVAGRDKHLRSPDFFDVAKH